MPSNGGDASGFGSSVYTIAHRNGERIYAYDTACGSPEVSDSFGCVAYVLEVVFPFRLSMTLIANDLWQPLCLHSNVCANVIDRPEKLENLGSDHARR